MYMLTNLIVCWQVGVIMTTSYYMYQNFKIEGYTVHVFFMYVWVIELKILENWKQSWKVKKFNAYASWNFTIPQIFGLQTVRAIH